MLPKAPHPFGTLLPRSLDWEGDLGGPGVGSVLERVGRHPASREDEDARRASQESGWEQTSQLPLLQHQTHPFS